MGEKISMRCDSCGTIYTESRVDIESVERVINADGTLKWGYCQDCFQEFLRSPFKQLELVARARESDEQS